MNSKILISSFIGSTLFIFWLVLLNYNKISYQLKRKFLIIVIISFLFPIPELKNFYLDLLNALFKWEPKNTGTIIDLKNFIHFGPNGKILHFSHVNYLYIILFLLWLLVCFLFLIKQLRCYKKLQLLLNFGKFKSVNIFEESILEREKKQLKITKPIKIKRCEFLSVPMTTGFFKPIILLPNKDITKDDILFIIKHELIHIKQHDYLLKLLASAVIIIHWFNPLVYFLSSKASTICEFSCDEQVVINLTKKERKKYAFIILKMSCKITKGIEIYFLPVSYFGNSEKKLMKKRIEKIKETVVTTTHHKIIAIIIWITAITISTFEILFYQEDPIIYQTDLIEFDMESDYYEINTENINKKYTFNVEAQDTVNFLIYENGDYSTVFSKEQHGYENCEHKYLNITYVTHTLNNKANCILEYNYAKKCKICGKIIIGEQYDSETHIKCFH